jgi:hypothetical protein
MLEPLHNLLKKHQKNDPSVLFAPRVCYSAQQAVEELDINAGNANVVSYKNGRLKIATVNPAVSHLIKLNEEEIIKKVRRETNLDTPIKIFYTTQGQN